DPDRTRRDGPEIPRLAADRLGRALFRRAYEADAPCACLPKGNDMTSSQEDRLAWLAFWSILNEPSSDAQVRNQPPARFAAGLRSARGARQMPLAPVCPREVT